MERAFGPEASPSKFGVSNGSQTVMQTALKYNIQGLANLTSNGIRKSISAGL
jgi:hypothetical protein